MPPYASSNGIMEAFSISRNSRHIVWSPTSENGLGTTRDHTFPTLYEGESEIIDVLLELRYFTSFNFVGARIDGYEEPVALLTKEAAEGLKKASERFKERDLIIKIWDSYRPKSAVDHFVRWSKDFNDYKMKDYFFPDLTKEEVFAQGFVATKSGHSRGSTLDMTLVYKKNGTELDFGTGFDFFGNRSNTNSTLVTEEQQSNRNYLKEVMEESGFENLPEEWWHYTLKNEPFPNTYFNFPVNATLIKQGN